MSDEIKQLTIKKQCSTCNVLSINFSKGRSKCKDCEAKYNKDFHMKKQMIISTFLNDKLCCDCGNKNKDTLTFVSNIDDNVSIYKTNLSTIKLILSNCSVLCFNCDKKRRNIIGLDYSNKQLIKNNFNMTSNLKKCMNCDMSVTYDNWLSFHLLNRNKILICANCKHLTLDNSHKKVDIYVNIEQEDLLSYVPASDDYTKRQSELLIEWLKIRDNNIHKLNEILITQVDSPTIDFIPEQSTSSINDTRTIITPVKKTIIIFGANPPQMKKCTSTCGKEYPYTKPYFYGKQHGRCVTCYKNAKNAKNAKKAQTKQNNNTIDDETKNVLNSNSADNDKYNLNEYDDDNDIINENENTDIDNNKHSDMNDNEENVDADNDNNEHSDMDENKDINFNENEDDNEDDNDNSNTQVNNSTPNNNSKSIADDSTKHCRKCNKTLPLSSFAVNNDNSDGKQAYCTNCKKLYNKKANKEKPHKIQSINKTSKIDEMGQITYCCTTCGEYKSDREMSSNKFKCNECRRKQYHEDPEKKQKINEDRKRKYHEDKAKVNDNNNNN